MGGKHSKNHAHLKSKTVQELMGVTHFAPDELEQLWQHFQSISASIDDDGVIDSEELQTALGLTNTTLAQRIFEVFDKNGDKAINFREFVCGLSVLCPRGTAREKLQFSFKIYDIDGDGSISKEELYTLLKASMFEALMDELTEDQMRQLVDNTFEEVDTNGDGQISFEEYASMVSNYPAIIDSLTISDEVLRSPRAVRRKSEPGGSGVASPSTTAKRSLDMRGVKSLDSQAKSSARSPRRSSSSSTKIKKSPRKSKSPARRLLGSGTSKKHASSSSLNTSKHGAGKSLASTTSSLPKHSTTVDLKREKRKSGSAERGDGGDDGEESRSDATRRSRSGTK